ncbi:hypothetical protein NK6_8925 [Bradyrhizobium diazoefficiens]|uniref:Caspase family p20 domain-containing protein n=1 Tax=Bradyrhizobium diazoefficiens TaxID=1355477 RepID=A0A0E4BX08_9BRAD|nr:hypothetical protein NK6_8925 [Bradyrhizobium diazoefficiens]
MRYLTLIASLMCMALSVSAAKADRRVAFVVGNGSYKNVAQLPNPPIDAKAMAATLRNVGFDVIEGSNLSRDQMTEKLLDFGRKAQGSDIALFYYAGHGIAVGGTNYLLPVDADIKSEMDVKLGAAINIDLTLEQTMGDAKVKLVFLDACRDNPFAAKIKSNSATRSVNVQSGLAEMKSGEGTLIAFATGPGQTALDGQEGNNSPFTRALIDNITKPGIEIQQAMTSVRAQVNEETHKGQLPWGHTNLIGAVYLNQAPTTQVANAAPTAAGSVPAATGGSDGVELEYWRSVKESNKPEELNAYLSAYPNGQFKALALARLAAIKSGPRPRRAPSTPASILRPSPMRPLRLPRTRSASTRTSAATCSVASPASASTPSRLACSATRPGPCSSAGRPRAAILRQVTSTSSSTRRCSRRSWPLRRLRATTARRRPGAPAPPRPAAHRRRLPNAATPAMRPARPSSAASSAA